MSILTMLTDMGQRRRQDAAQRALFKMVEANRNSPLIVDYRIRRAAALRGCRK
ncbi:hypothetical protein [Sphingomonas sp. MA1305]|uniref:hypothetical protein n=1 Tax=Sphingomonas sp. MA1305 TaxID=2479204 RepID=UPI0018DF7D77|nr:hypothetical protein [Sphingomonas sp. MA1305]